MQAIRLANRAAVYAWGTLGVSLILVAWLGRILAFERYPMLLLAGLGVLQLSVTLFRWRLSVYLLTVYVMIEGFIVNYYAGKGVLNLVKDGLILSVFLALLFMALGIRQRIVPKTSWMIPLVAYGVTYVVQVFNPNLPSVMVGVIGVRVALLFCVLFAVGYCFFNHAGEVARFLRFQTLLSIPLSAFGIVQYFTGPGLLLAISPGFERAIYYAEGESRRQVTFRTISTFASTGGFANYLMITTLLTVACLTTVKSRLWRAITLVAILLQMLALLTTGGRGPAVLLLLGVLLAFLLMRKLHKAVLFGSLAVMMFWIGLQAMGPGLLKRYGVILEWETVRSRNTPLLMQFYAAMQSPMEGLGSGRTSSASYRYAPEMPMIPVENQFAKARYEIGLFGVMIFALLVGLIAVEVTYLTVRVRHPALRAVASCTAACVLVMVIIMPIGMPLDIPPLNFFFWFLLGMIYALWRLDREWEPVSGRSAFANGAR